MLAITRGGSNSENVRTPIRGKRSLGNRYSRRDAGARNHFHRSSFEGKDYGESVKREVDPDVMGRSNYSELKTVFKLISSADPIS